MNSHGDNDAKFAFCFAKRYGDGNGTWCNSNGESKRYQITPCGIFRFTAGEIAVSLPAEVGGYARQGVVPDVSPTSVPARAYPDRQGLEQIKLLWILSAYTNFERLEAKL